MIRLRLLSRPGCHLCEEMHAEVDRLLEGVGQAHTWEIVDVDSDDELARRWSDSITVTSWSLAISSLARFQPTLPAPAMITYI